jgi:hypothetical protein
MPAATVRDQQRRARPTQEGRIMADKHNIVPIGGNDSEPPKIAVPEDAQDFESLWLDPTLGDGIVDVHYHRVTVDKPRDFFRTHPDKTYRRRAEIYTHKVEGQIEETHYILAPSMHGQIPEARPCTLVTVVYRDGTPRLWPIKFPKEGERDNEAWITARSAAKVGIGKWVKLVWVKRAYLTRDALEGYAPDPDFNKLPSFTDLVRMGFGEHGIIRGTTHPIYRELFGMPKQAADDDAGTDL